MNTMTIKRVYTVNGKDYTDLKEAKKVSAMIELEGMFGKEVATKLVENATKLAPILHELKIKKVVVKKAKVADGVETKPKAKKEKATA